MMSIVLWVAAIALLIGVLLLFLAAGALVMAFWRN